MLCELVWSSRLIFNRELPKYVLRNMRYTRHTQSLAFRQLHVYRAPAHWADEIYQRVLE